MEVSWHEFLRYMRWTPADVDELPDDFLYVEWGIYSLKVKYGIPIE